MQTRLCASTSWPQRCAARGRRGRRRHAAIESAVRQRRRSRRWCGEHVAGVTIVAADHDAGESLLLEARVGDQAFMEGSPEAPSEWRAGQKGCLTRRYLSRGLLPALLKDMHPASVCSSRMWRLFVRKAVARFVVVTLIIAKYELILMGGPPGALGGTGSARGALVS